MKWSKELPTKPGQWWYRNKPHAITKRTVLVWETCDGNLRAVFMQNLLDGGEWAGPIPEPEEAQ